MNEVNIFEEIYEQDAAGDGIESLDGVLTDVLNGLSGTAIYNMDHLREQVEFLRTWNLSRGINATLEEMLEVIDSL